MDELYKCVITPCVRLYNLRSLAIQVIYPNMQTQLEMMDLLSECPPFKQSQQQTGETKCEQLELPLGL